MQKFIIIILVVTFFWVGPSYAQLSERVVELKRHSGSDVVDKIIYTMPIPKGLSGSRFKDAAQQCILRNIEFPDFMAYDSSRSFVGEYSGTYYRFGDNTLLEGTSDVLAFVSKTKPLVIGRGRENLGTLISKTIQFNVVLSIEGEKIKDSYENVLHAQKNTGGFENTGFTVVRKQWAGGYKAVYMGADRVTVRLADCLKSAAPQNLPSQNLTPQDAAIQDLTPLEAPSQDANPQDETPLDVSSQDAAPQDVSSQEAAPLEATSQDEAPQDAAPQDNTAPQDAAPQDVISQEVTSQEATPQDEAAQDVISQEATSQDVISQDAAPQEAAPQDEASQEAAPTE